ncbi:MAG: sigma-70 family RNA polymerase sigma factor [Bacteroidota bacterium]
MFRKSGNIKSFTDEDLIRRYRNSHDANYVGELFERYTHVVFLVCMKYLKDPVESEDMVMQIFEKLLEDLKKYNVKSFKHWLHTVTKNQCLIKLDKEKRKRHKVDEFRETQQALMESGQDSDLLDAEEREVQINHLESALKLLNEQQRRCVELFYLQKMSYQEVADKTGYDMKQVKSYIQNGKRNLKKHLEKIGADTFMGQANE